MSATSSRIESTVNTNDRPVHVVGGCHVGRDVASRLASRGLTVHLHDPTPPDDLPANLRVHESPEMDAKSLADSGLDDESIFLAINPSDSTNFLLAQVARTRFGVDCILARVNDPQRISAFEAADIETIDCTAILGQAIADRC